MDWLIIIFLVFGVISKLMGGNERKNGRARPSQRTSRTPSQRTNPVPETRSEPWATQYPKQTRRPTFDPFDPPEVLVEEVPQVVEDIKDSSLKESPIVNKTNEKATPSSQALVQGIIWSEILGAPRSKRPHRTVSYKRIR